MIDKNNKNTHISCIKHNSNANNHRNISKSSKKNERADTMLTQARNKRINATKNHTDHKKTQFPNAFKLRRARGKNRATTRIETRTTETSAIARCITSFRMSTCNAI